jgi:glycosyltransferase involved in cell wall biosynthesis
MVKRGDAAGFTAGMLQLIESPERRIAMGQSAAARVRESFTLDDTIRRYDALYRPINANSH